MAQFNPTSINTLRIATYRDVKTGNIIILGALLRMGKRGAFVDNVTSGGAFVSVDENGKLGKKVLCDVYGHTTSVYNDIDFSNREFVIPNYDKVKSFVLRIAKRMPHMSLFANDVFIDESGNPKLMEVNTTHISCRLFQFFQPMFGVYTDDLIAYCKKEMSNVRMGTVLKYN